MIKKPSRQWRAKVSRLKYIRQLSFHQRMVLAESFFLLLGLVFQLLAVLTVPLTNLTLCTFKGYKYGVFGICDKYGCTPPSISYKPELLATFQKFTLPSNARHSISLLLVVHPISAVFMAVEMFLTVMLYWEKFALSYRYLIVLMSCTLITFMTCLLAFLIDLLLFIPHAGWCTWLLLGSTIIVALTGTSLCITRRALTSRHLRAYKSFEDRIYQTIEEDTSSSDYSDSESSFSSLGTEESDLLQEHNLTWSLPTDAPIGLSSLSTPKSKRDNALLGSYINSSGLNPTAVPAHDWTLSSPNDSIFVDTDDEGDGGPVDQSSAKHSRATHSSSTTSS